MKISARVVFVAAAVALVLGVLAPGARAAEEKEANVVKLGELTCKTLPGTEVKLFLRSSVAVDCTFKQGGQEEHYKGELGFLGVDLRKKSEETLYFAVMGATANVPMGGHALVGDYVGASVSAGIYKEGYGTTMLVGGFQKGFSLVPSVDTFKGIGLTIGGSRMHLEPKK